ncbi:terpene cyclase/mutase family protein [Nitrospira defluvii]|nr:terpene cyclase/mutase family protein [Nitrospira defluvii]
MPDSNHFFNYLKIKIWILFYILAFSLPSSFAFAQQAAIDNGLTYLQSTQSTDGSWGGTPTSLNTIHQTTTTTARTLQILDIIDTTLTSALIFLSSQTPNTVDDLAQQLEVRAASGADVTAQVATIKAAQQANGGWGPDSEGIFKSEVIDTVSALRALSVAGDADVNTVNNALSFLLVNQNADGGWGDSKEKESHVYYTALVLRYAKPFCQPV